MGMGFKFQMGMGIKSLKLEGFVTKNLYPHISTWYIYLLREWALLNIFFKVRRSVSTEYSRISVEKFSAVFRPQCQGVDLYASLKICSQHCT